MRKFGSRLLLCASLSGSAVLYATVLAAAPATRPSDDDPSVSVARERFKEGVAFFDKKEFEKARLAFLQAYALKKHPAVLLNLAQSELRSAHEADAAQHFSEYLRAGEGTAAERQAAEAGLGAAKASVVEVVVVVDESAADVYVDRVFEGTSPLPGAIYVGPGAHLVEARKADRSASSPVNGVAGSQVTAQVALAPKSAPVPLAASAPIIEPQPAPELPPEGGGRKPFFRWLVTTPAGLIGLGLTSAGVGTGIGFAVASHKAYSNSDSIADQISRAAANDSAPSAPETSSLCSDPAAFLGAVDYDEDRTPDLATRVSQYKNACSSYADAVDKGDRYKTISAVGFVVGAASAVGTVVLYFATAGEEKAAPSARNERRFAVTPSVSRAFTGLALSGEF